ncbi:MAG: hypothetical protein A2162_06705 [Deltaproteobacteria bacterium RBG_13_52_11b]|nr:MAG: hypothetical protein A2162_06705 [Deltaproteobacteria bacterium RBG_13_52_11b]
MEDQKTQEAKIEAFYWERLSQFHPTDVCNRSEAIYNPAREGFVLPVYNLRYLILPNARKILRVETNDRSVEEALSHFFHLMVFVYLIEAKESKPSHTWISEKDLQGGGTFFRGPHRLDVSALENLYGRDPEAFLKAGRKLGGSEILYGDRGFALEVFPKVPVAYVLWKGDEEFPPRIGVLFDATIQDHFTLDVIWCMVSETTRRLAEHSL